MQQQNTPYASHQQQYANHRLLTAGSNAGQQQSSSFGHQSAYQGANSVGGGSRLITGGAISSGMERVQSTRKISSTIVNEQIMGPPPQDYPVREVEVPGPTEEVIKVVPKKVVQEIEKRVPKVVYEYVDKVVEVPRVEYVDRVVEKVQYQDVPVPRKVVKTVDVPREVIVEKKIPKVNYVQKVVEVPGPVVPVPKPYDVDQIVEMTQYTDRKRPVVVAQAVRPLIVEGAGFTEVDVYEYEPECIPVDVHVVKGVQAQIQSGGVVESVHKVVSVPSAQYNTLLKQMNVHLSEAEVQKLPYLVDQGNNVTMLGESVMATEVPRGTYIAGLEMQSMTNTWVDHSSRKVLPVNDPRAMDHQARPPAQYGSSKRQTRLTQYSTGQYAAAPNAAATTPLQTPAYAPTYDQRYYAEQQSASYAQQIPSQYHHQVNPVVSYAGGYAGGVAHPQNYITYQ